MTPLKVRALLGLAFALIAIGKAIGLDVEGNEDDEVFLSTAEYEGRRGKAARIIASMTFLPFRVPILTFLWVMSNLGLAVFLVAGFIGHMVLKHLFFRSSLLDQNAERDSEPPDALVGWILFQIGVIPEAALILLLIGAAYVYSMHDLLHEVETIIRERREMQRERREMQTEVYDRDSDLPKMPITLATRITRWFYEQAPTPLLHATGLLGWLISSSLYVVLLAVEGAVTLVLKYIFLQERPMCFDPNFENAPPYGCTRDAWLLFHVGLVLDAACLCMMLVISAIASLPIIGGLLLEEQAEKAICRRVRAHSNS
jgi:hypothetical protein